MPLDAVDLKQLKEGTQKTYRYNKPLTAEDVDILAPALTGCETLEACHLQNAELEKLNVTQLGKLLHSLPSTLIRLDISQNKFKREHETVLIIYLSNCSVYELVVDWSYLSPHATKTLKESLEKNKIKQKFNLFTKQGLEHVNARRYTEAITAYTSALVQRPDDAQTLTYRGQAYFAAKKYREAIEDFTRSIALRPNDAATLACLGKTHVAMFQYDEAITAYKRSLDIRPNDLDTLHCLEQAYNAIGITLADSSDHASSQISQKENNAGNNPASENNVDRDHHQHSATSQADTKERVEQQPPAKPSAKLRRYLSPPPPPPLAPSALVKVNVNPTPTSAIVPTAGDTKESAEVALTPWHANMPDISHLLAENQRELKALREKLGDPKQNAGATVSEADRETLQTLRREKEQEQQILQKRRWILEDDNRAEYYYAFQMQFNDYFLGCKTLHSGLVGSASDSVDLALRGIEKIIGQVPIIGLVFSAIETGIQARNYRNMKEMINQSASYFPGAQSIEVIGEALARELTMHFDETIRQKANTTNRGPTTIRFLQKLKDLKNKLTVNDINTPIRELAAEHCKRFCTAILKKQLKQDPKLTDIPVLLAVIVKSDTPIQTPAIAPLTTMATTQTVVLASTRASSGSNVEQLVVKLEILTEELAEEKRKREEIETRHRQDSQDLRLLLEQHRTELQRTRNELEEFRTHSREASGNVQSLALASPTATAGAQLGELTEVVGRHDETLRMVVQRVEALSVTNGHTDNTTLSSPDSDGETTRVALFSLVSNGGVTARKSSKNGNS